jgi:hypothetical protein
MGQSILEEVPVTTRYKAWIDAVSEIFGGLAICSLEAVVAKDGKEFIIEVNDSAMTLMGDSQEDDRRIIADMVLNQMEEKCKPAVDSVTKATSKTHISSDSTSPSPVPSLTKQVIKPSTSSGTVTKDTPAKSRETPEPPTSATVSKTKRERHDSQDSTASESSTVSGVSSASSAVRRDTDKERADEADTETNKQTVDENGEPPIEGEDTMKNLRKTFAGIFGDIA